jgi:hypothetical protein
LVISGIAPALCGGAMAILCACEDFEPPANPVAVLVDAGSAAPPSSPGTARPPPAQSDAGAGDVSAPAAPIARATPNYVVIADPRDHAAVLIDAQSLQALRVPCGDAPVRVGAAEDADVALVVDVEGEQACALQVDDGEVRSASVNVVPHVNRIEFAPHARFALAFHDASAERAGGTVRVTQELSVITLGDGDATATTVVIGLRPRALAFSDDGARAFLVCDAGIATIDLAQATQAPVAHAKPSDFGLDVWSGGAIVRIAPDADYAVAFEPGSDTLHGLDLQRGEAVRVDLSSWSQSAALDGDGGVPAQPRIADAALSPDGTSLWVALRDEHALLRVPLPGAGDAPESIELHELDGQPSDRLAWVGDERALFVHAAAPDDGRALLIAPEDPSEHEQVTLARAPDGVLAAEDGEALGLLHEGPHRLAGYTVLRVRGGAARFRQTDAPPLGIAVSSAAGALAAIVAASGERDAELHVVDFETLALHAEALPAAPRAVGFVGEGRYVYAELEHPDGRLIFVEIESGDVRTATGFLIAERVRE